MRISALIVVLFTAIQASAQLPAKEETGFVYRYELMGGLTFHTNGWGFHFDYAKHKTYLSRIIYGLEITTLKHPKETKVPNPYYEEAKDYYFGKLNSVFVIRPTIGYRRIVFQKLRDRGVEVSLSVKGGPALGMLKPVYLEIGYDDGSNPNGNPYGYDYIAEERYNPEVHNLENIYGRAPYARGLGEVGINPGVFGKVGMMFDFAPKGDGIFALETGMYADAYLNRMNIMAVETSRRFHLNLYLSVVFGGRKF
jgi:hypothetical protein